LDRAPFFNLYSDIENLNNSNQHTLLIKLDKASQFFLKSHIMGFINLTRVDLLHYFEGMMFDGFAVMGITELGVPAHGPGRHQ
jgi:hypothetical protein